MIPFLLLYSVDGLLNENLAHFFVLVLDPFTFMSHAMCPSKFQERQRRRETIPWNFSHGPFCGCQHANVVKSLVQWRGKSWEGLFGSDPLSDDMPLPPLGVLQVKRLRVLAAARQPPLLPPLLPAYLINISLYV